MPKIARKGDSLETAFTATEVTLRWSEMSEDADFDLAILYKKKGSDAIGVCWGLEMGSLEAYPFMKHSGDAIGDDEEEEVLIERPQEFDTIWVFVWEYGDPDDGGGVVSGDAANIGSGAVSVCIVDDHAIEIEVPLVVAADSPPANCFCIATLDCSGNQLEVINTSDAGIIHRLTSSEQLLALIGQNKPSYTHASIEGKGPEEPVPDAPKPPAGTDAYVVTTEVRKLLDNHAKHQQERAGDSRVLSAIHEHHVAVEAKKFGFSEQSIEGAVTSWLINNSWKRFDDLREKCVQHIGTARSGMWVPNNKITNARKTCRQVRYPQHSTERLINEILTELGCKSEADVDKEWIASVDHYLRSNNITSKYKTKNFDAMLRLVLQVGFDETKAKSKLEGNLNERGLVQSAGFLGLF